MKYLVYPANKAGVIVKGFCPTVCNSEAKAISEAVLEQFLYSRSGVYFHHIEITFQD